MGVQVLQKETLDDWYESMKNFDHDKADNQKAQIESHLDDYKEDPEIWKFYSLLSGRFYLLNYDLEKAAENLSKVKPWPEEKFHWLNYYYNFFNGMVQYELKDYKRAIHYYLKAKQFISDLNVQETAEFLYKLGSAYHRDFQHSRSIKYTTRALRIFSNKLNFKRMADCKNLLGNNFMQVYDYKESEANFKRAVFYAEKANNSDLKTIILHNLGYLYTEIDLEVALKYLKQAYVVLQNHDKYFKCQNLFLLSRSYFSLGSKKEATFYLNQGLCLSEDQHYLDYYHHFKILECKYLTTGHNQFETTYKEAIDYFCEHCLWEYVMEFSEEFAVQLRDTGKHEEATHFFKLAIDAKSQQQHI